MSSKRKLKTFKKKKMNVSNTNGEGNRLIALEDAIDWLINENKRLKTENEVLKIKLRNDVTFVNNLIEKVNKSNECQIINEESSSESVQRGHCLIT